MQDVLTVQLGMDTIQSAMKAWQSEDSHEHRICQGRRWLSLALVRSSPDHPFVTVVASTGFFDGPEMPDTDDSDDESEPC